MREHNRQYDPIAALVAIGTGVATGVQVNQATQAKKAAKNAKNDAIADNAKAVADVQKAQQTASSQAKTAIQKRKASMTQTTFTNPLGTSGSADVARKTLLGM